MALLSLQANVTGASEEHRKFRPANIRFDVT